MTVWTVASGFGACSACGHNLTLTERKGVALCPETRVLIQYKKFRKRSFWKKATGSGCGTLWLVPTD